MTIDTGTDRTESVRSPFVTWVKAVPDRAPATVGIATFVAILASVLIRNPLILGTGLIEYGDASANSILIERATHVRLLVGNYSRVGFNHPGPALLYVQALAQLFLHDWLPLLPARYNAHLLGIVTMNAALIGLAAHAITRSTRSVFAGLCVVPLALALVWAEPGTLASTWFPDIYIWPFFLFCIAGATLLAGEQRTLPSLAIASGLLVHGHVSFVLFVLGMWAVVGLLTWRNSRHGVAVQRRPIVVAVGIAILFVLPILINTAMNWPGEIPKYFRYSEAPTTGGHAVSDVARFLLQYWPSNASGLTAAAGLLVAAIALTRNAVGRVRRTALTLLVVTALITCLAFVYAYRGVDDLSYRYIGLFYAVAPLLVVLSVLVSASSPMPSGVGRAAPWIALVLVSMFLMRDPRCARNTADTTGSPRFALPSMRRWRRGRLRCFGSRHGLA